MSYLVLTADEAAKVSGANENDPSARLAPQLLRDGRYVLAVSVVDETVDEERRRLLADAPRVESVPLSDYDWYAKSGMQLL